MILPGKNLLLRRQRLASHSTSFCVRTELPPHHREAERARMIAVPDSPTVPKLAEVIRNTVWMMVSEHELSEVTAS